MQANRIYTLGTGRRSEEDFIEILNGYFINAVIDIRSTPKSKIPAFNKPFLQSLLLLNGIGYYYLGHELGGFRKGGYLAYTSTEAFLRGIGELEAIATKAVPVIICAEKLPWKCHRKWVARELGKRGWSVIHIIEKGSLWVPG